MMTIVPSAEVCRLRRWKRMLVLRDRKLGHYGWQELKLKMIQDRKVRDERRRRTNAFQHRMARRAWDEYDEHRYLDGLRHKIAREHWSTEQLLRVRAKDAERHRLAQAHLTDMQRQQIRKKNVMMHQLTRFRKKKYSNKERQYINNIIQYHNQNCKPLGQCTTECNYREIYEYITDNDERKRIREAIPTGHYKWNYYVEHGHLLKSRVKK